MYCSKCGEQSSEGDLFCRKCGSQFSDATPMPTPDPATTTQPRQNEVVTKQKSGFAVASLILGIVGLIISPCLIFGLVFGALALVQTGNNYNLSGRGIAVAGFFISPIGIILWVLAVIFFLHSLRSVVSPAL